jgi:tRNA dimethylallyltransferase
MCDSSIKISLMKDKPKLIVILGQTATGKSDFAVEIAHKVNGEIISADSRQVYIGMDLGTGKITKKEMKGIPHHLLDVVSPKKVFSVSDFKKLADIKIQEILERGHTPIICGGTGFYIDAVVDNMILPEVPANAKLRKELSRKTLPQLISLLNKLDPNRLKTVDINNPVRLIRAIEIAKALGKVPKVKRNQRYNVLKIGLTLPDEILKEKIKIRLVSRIKKGMLKEIQNLHDNGISWRRMDMLGLEYKYGALYLQKKITKEEMIEKLNNEIWHYAKRQKTWFKRGTGTLWIDPRKTNQKISTVKMLKVFK